MDFSFLAKVTVAAVEPAKRTATARPKKQYQPLTADLRIWNSGAIFPSDELIANYSLEYSAKDAENKGLGLDIIDIRQMPAINSDVPFVAISFTAKNLSKVDIFGSVGYNEDGSPKATVADQGAATFGKEVLLPLLKEVYNVEPNEEGFIDLKIHFATPFNSPNGIYQFPKTVSRGEKKGEITYVRRENQAVFALEALKFAEVKVETESFQEELLFPADIAEQIENADPFADDIDAAIPVGRKATARV